MAVTTTGAVRWAAAAALATVLLSACQTTVTGTAMRPPGPIGLRETDLDTVLLPIDEFNATVGAVDMVVTVDSADMGDHSDEVSDRDCLGAVYSAEETVYAGSGWTAVRDQVAAEPGDGNEHWAQQTAVLFPIAAQAADFVERSRSDWERCAGQIVTVSDGVETFRWELRDVGESDGMVTQSSSQEVSDGWSCQHAISDVSNVVVEAWACGYAIDDQAVALARALMANVDRI